jgi:riboflavin kinase / FMN adenylyltransferase
MRVWPSISSLAELPGPLVLALGVFDGLHLGHRAVIEAAFDLAGRIGGRPVVATFDPHPARLLRPAAAPPVLTSLPHKRLLLQRLGLADLLVIPFTRELAALAATDFVRALTDAARPLGGIAVGRDFCFGHARSGDVALLSDLGARLNFAVAAVPPVEVAGARVSSTRLRQAVACGDFALADRLLGREHTVLGTVVKGRQLGRTLGFPTANLAVHCEQLPPSGVYAVAARTGDDTSLAGVANLGLRPTITAAAIDGQALEVHLFDFSGDLYGQDLEIRFRRFLRPERKFSGLAELQAAIAADCRAARAINQAQAPATDPAG